MAAERCPLCQSRLKNGECESCGYRLPDEGDISALYNYDPTDYPQEQPAVREITPEHQMEEIYPNRPEPIDFKVRDNDGKTVKGNGNHSSGVGQNYNQNRQQPQPYQPYYGNNSQYGQYGGQNNQQGQQPYYRNNGQYGQYRQTGQYGRQNNQNGQNGQPYQQPYYRNNGQYGQYRQNGQYGGYNNQNQPYYINNGNYQQYNGSSSQNMEDLKDFLLKYWWLLLILFFMPFPFNAVIYAVIKKMNIGIHEKFYKLMIIVLILGIILPPY